MTAKEICNDPDCNRIMLKSDIGQHTGFIIKVDDSEAFGCVGWARERHMNAISRHLKSIFQKILDDTKTRKDDLERS